LSLNTCPYLATSSFRYRPTVSDSNEATTILTPGGMKEGGPSRADGTTVPRWKIM